MKILETLAKMVGVRSDQAEDALGDVQRAKQAVRLSRRGFFAAGACMAAAPLVPTKAYGFLFEAPPAIWAMPPWGAGILGGGLYMLNMMYRIGKANQAAVQTDPALAAEVAALLEQKVSEVRMPAPNGELLVQLASAGVL